MKHCFIISVFYISIAFYGTAHTAGESDKGSFQENLNKYIKDMRSEANTALTVQSVPFIGSSVVNFFSRRYGKGCSVDRNDLALLIAYDDADYKEAIALQDPNEIRQFAQKVYDAVKHEKDVNKWHDQLYEVISKHNSEKLFQDKDLSRSVAMEKMVENKNDINVKKQFVFGIAVTKTVEEMMKKK